MNKIAEFFNKWGFTMFISLVGIAVLFAIGCCIYTAVVNPFVGILGLLGSLAAFGIIAQMIYKEVKNDTTDNRN